jgi:hypothetical protein
MNPWEEILAHATRARVKDEYDLMEMISDNKVERLEAENARLRAALNKLKRECTYCSDPENYTCSVHGDQIFSAALEGKE